MEQGHAPSEHHVPCGLLNCEHGTQAPRTQTFAVTFHGRGILRDDFRREARGHERHARLSARSRRIRKLSPAFLTATESTPDTTPCRVSSSTSGSVAHC